MSVSNDMSGAYNYSSDMASGIRIRAGLLLLISCLSVALAFGASFYFALVSNQTAVARQFPELSSTVERFKGMLVMNTFSLVAVIIASFWVLARMVTARLFAPIGTVMTEMKRAGENRLPENAASSGSGPFEPFENQWAGLLSSLRTNEQREIAALRECAASLAGPGAEPALDILQGIIERKEIRLGTVPAQRQAAAGTTETTADPVFMQPL